MGVCIDVARCPDLLVMSQILMIPRPAQRNCYVQDSQKSSLFKTKYFVFYKFYFNKSYYTLFIKPCLNEFFFFFLKEFCFKIKNIH